MLYVVFLICNNYLEAWLIHAHSGFAVLIKIVSCTASAEVLIDMNGNLETFPDSFKFQSFYVFEE